MVQFLIYLFVAYGISNIVINGSIFEKFREFWKPISPKFFYPLFNCFICFPTWVGFFLSWLVWSPTEYYQIVTEGVNLSLITIPRGFISVFLDGCLVSGGVWFINTVQEYFEK